MSSGSDIRQSMCMSTRDELAWRQRRMSDALIGVALSGRTIVKLSSVLKETGEGKEWFVSLRERRLERAGSGRMCGGGAATCGRDNDGVNGASGNTLMFSRRREEQCSDGGYRKWRNLWATSSEDVRIDKAWICGVFA